MHKHNVERVNYFTLHWQLDPERGAELLITIGL